MIILQMAQENLPKRYENRTHRYMLYIAQENSDWVQPILQGSNMRFNGAMMPPSRWMPISRMILAICRIFSMLSNTQISSSVHDTFLGDAHLTGRLSVA